MNFDALPAQTFLVLKQLTVAALISFSVAGCSGSGSAGPVPAVNDADPVILQLSLTAGNGNIDTKATGDGNLIDLSDLWQTWAGDTSTVSYDRNAGVLRIPAPEDDSGLTKAVRRFDQPLSAGMQYTLTVSASDSQAGAIIFLFDQSGFVQAVTQPNGSGLAIAKPGVPLTFTASGNVAGFYLQVQNRWRTNAETTLRAEINRSESSASVGENLISLAPDWEDWDGRPTRVRYDADADRLVVPPPVNGTGNTYALRRFGKPLIADEEYELSADVRSGIGASVLLFLFDVDGQVVPFADGVTETPWLTTTRNKPMRFLAPANVVRFGIQVQSPWNARSESSVRPGLHALGAAVCTAPTPIQRVDLERISTNTGEAPDNAVYDTSISADGQIVAFESLATKFVPGLVDTNGAPPLVAAKGFDYFFYNRQTRLSERVSDGVDEAPFRSGPWISRNGRFIIYAGPANIYYFDADGPGPLQQVLPDGSGYTADGSVSNNGRIAFSSSDPNLIGGQTDGNGRVRDIFLFDPAIAQIVRVSAGLVNTSALDAPAISADGRFVAYWSQGNIAPGLSVPAGDVKAMHLFDSQTGQTVSIGYDQNNYSSAVPRISANGRYVVFGSRLGGLIPGEPEFNDFTDDLFIYDRFSNSLTRVTPGSGGGSRPSGRFAVAISPDGGYVVYQAFGAAYMYQRATGRIERLLPSHLGTVRIQGLSISANGRFVSFTSPATNLVAQADLNPEFDLFVAEVTRGCY